MRFLLPLLLAGLLISPTAHAQTGPHDACLTTSDNNATVVVRRAASLDLGNGASLAPGDTLMAYTDGGVCAGFDVWTSTDDVVSFPVMGPNTAVETPEGYSPGESLKLRVVDASAGEVVDLGADLQYSACDAVELPTCRTDGAYDNGALFLVEALTAGSTLPVEMTAFRATRQGNRVRLAWETATETQNAGWELQHQTDGATEWNALGFVEGQGTTTAPQQYAYRTDALDVGTHRFRLKQVDLDGTTTLSDPVEAAVALEVAYELSAVYPNPVQGSGRLELVVREAQTVSAALYDLLGRKVATLYRGALGPSRPQEIQIDARRHSSGAYFVRVTGETFATTRRFTVVR